MKIFVRIFYLAIAAWLSTGYAVACVFGTASTAAEAQIDISFDDKLLFGGCDIAGWKEQWGIGFENRIAVAGIGDGMVQGTKALRIGYPQGGVGPANSGAQFPIVFHKIEGMTPYFDTYYLSYHVFFEHGFDFKKGGKLPGLMGGGDSWKRSGGDIPDGTNGWTMRFMWREGGRAVIYAYLPPSTKRAIGQWGTDIPLKDSDRNAIVFTTGKWIHIEQLIRLNTVELKVGKLHPNEDGVLQVWIDKEKVLDLNDVSYRTEKNTNGQIGGIYFSTFHGGNDESWGPAQSSFARYDRIFGATNR